MEIPLRRNKICKTEGAYFRDQVNRPMIVATLIPLEVYNLKESTLNTTLSITIQNTSNKKKLVKPTNGGKITEEK